MENIVVDVPLFLLVSKSLSQKSTSRSASVLEAWKKVWTDVGWELVVLYLGDAIHHPRSGDITDAFENSSGDCSMSVQDRVRFCRWFEMAVSGGGWMADVDAFPLHTHPNKHGKEAP